MKKRILCFGDSNTWGQRSEGSGRYPEGVRWTSILQEKLGNDYTVIEEGHNGRTTVWDDPIENRLAGLTYLWPCMDSQHPFDLIVIMLGTNDTKPYFGMEPMNIARGAARLAHIASTSNFGVDDNPPKVLLISPILIRDDTAFPGLFEENQARKSRGFADAFRHYAELEGCAFMDAAKIAEAGPDGLHMDAANHAKFADAIYEKILEIIG